MGEYGTTAAGGDRSGPWRDVRRRSTEGGGGRRRKGSQPWEWDDTKEATHREGGGGGFRKLPRLIDRIGGKRTGKGTEWLRGMTTGTPVMGCQPSRWPDEGAAQREGSGIRGLPTAATARAATTSHETVRIRGVTRTFVRPVERGGGGGGVGWVGESEKAESL